MLYAWRPPDQDGILDSPYMNPDGPLALLMMRFPLKVRSRLPVEGVKFRFRPIAGHIHGYSSTQFAKVTGWDSFLRKLYVLTQQKLQIPSEE